jgi:thioredoxin-related protein
MNIKVLASLIGFLAVLSFFSFTENPKEEPGVKWLTLDEAIELSKSEKRPLLVDLYTDWCGWCKKMDRDTYSDAELGNYLNDNFYPVKLNAEQKEAIEFRGNTYNFVPQGRKGYHEFAVALTNGQLSYPTTVFLTKDMEVLHVQPGYLTVDQISPIVKYIGEAFPEKTFEEYQKEQSKS